MGGLNAFIERYGFTPKSIIEFKSDHHYIDTKIAAGE